MTGFHGQTMDKQFPADVARRRRRRCRHRPIRTSRRLHHLHIASEGLLPRSPLRARGATNRSQRTVSPASRGPTRTGRRRSREAAGFRPPLPRSCPRRTIRTSRIREGRACHANIWVHRNDAENILYECDSCLAGKAGSVSEFERQIRGEQERQRYEQERLRAWTDSPFSKRSPIVSTPRGAFASFVAEVFPFVPRRLWKRALIGPTPDGLTRVIIDWRRRFPDGVPHRAARRNAKRCPTCDIYAVGDFSYHDGLFILVRDGRAGFMGDARDLGMLRSRVVRAIAEREEYLGPFDIYEIGHWLIDG
jgi:hypothetical protein